ncbi:OmpH family outer membrane protein [Candidatus Pelagibacter sp. HIMB1542]|uniref:OmpH family outer membrane protein n=1 Tax=Candidatus Pelagibacter sp. HIMB1542 TaxID=3413346 RepID=UPI003F85BCB4
MIRYKNLIIVIFVLFFNTQHSNARDNIAFINLDILIQETNLGKSFLDEIKIQNNKNINELKKKELELKNDEEQLNKIKNIISKDEYEIKLNSLREKINKFRNKKNEMVKNIQQKRDSEIEIFFSKINPIIQDYMQKNSIDILLDQKNVFIGKSTSDITDKLLIEINLRFN